MNAQDPNTANTPTAPTATPPAAAPAPQPPQTPPALQQPVAPAPAGLVVRRSPGLAVVLSFFPGLGHLYLGLYQRAIGLFAAFVACIWMTDHVDAFGPVIAFVWFFALIDAYRQAHLINQGMLPEPWLGQAPKRAGAHGSLGFGVFLTALGLLLLYNQFYPIDFAFLYDWWPLILVGFGVYFIARYALDQKQRREAEAKARSEEWESSV